MNENKQMIAGAIKELAEAMGTNYLQAAVNPVRFLKDVKKRIEALDVDLRDALADVDYWKSEHDIVKEYNGRLKRIAEVLGQTVTLCDSTDPEHPVMDGKLWRAAMALLESAS